MSKTKLSLERGAEYLRVRGSDKSLFMLPHGSSGSPPKIIPFCCQGCSLGKQGVGRVIWVPRAL